MSKKKKSCLFIFHIFYSNLLIYFLKSFISEHKIEKEERSKSINS